MATKEEFWARKKQLNDDFTVLGSVANPATQEQILEYEKQTGFTFSDDFKDFLTTFGSLIFEVKESVWTRPQEYDVLPAWKFGYGFFVYGLSQDEMMPSWMTFDEKYNEALQYKEKPIGQMFFKHSGNGYRAYTNNGLIKIEYDKYDETDVKTFNGNLWDFLIQEIDNLENDYKKYLEEK